MKVYARRPRDVTDIIAMNPTPREIEFARRQAARVARAEPERAAAMNAFLDEWAAAPITRGDAASGKRSGRRRRE
jgi:hypothetical protein